jgi:adenosylcobinamide kinase/adenosylcobinamide-phosphate guanylyltransferase
VILVTGGARSGKSAFAERLALESGREVFYIATCTAGDEEMAQRIREHRSRRPPSWTTVEEPLQPGAVMRERDGPGRLFLLDCLTLLVSNLLLQIAGRDGEQLPARPDVSDQILRAADELAAVVASLEADTVVVTNEVGMGLVPDWPLGRIFRDLSGRVNQRFAALADEVYLMVCGIPLRVK